MTAEREPFRLSESANGARLDRDRRDGARGRIRHEYGNCAGIYGLCPACSEDEYNELLAWAECQGEPFPGDDPETYWKRIGGPYLDEWHNVARVLVSRKVGAA